MARKHEQTYFSIGVINKVVFAAVYSGLQQLAAFNGGFQNDKFYKVVNIFNINPTWLALQAPSMINSLKEKNN